MVKRRVRKDYRNSLLDERIRRERTVREATALGDARRAGVRAPSVLKIDLDDSSISMSFVDGTVARNRLDELSRPERLEALHEVGRQIGKLHDGGLVHGDMTTSNVILPTTKLAFIIDFGMSSHSTEPEDRGIDLHLLQRSISTSHVLDPGISEKAISEAYSEELGPKQADQSLRKQREIARRGRYFAIR